MSFPHQQALEVQIGRFTFESMLIKYSMSAGVFLTYIDGPTMANAYDFISMMCYVCSYHGYSCVISSSTGVRGTFKLVHLHLNPC